MPQTDMCRRTKATRRVVIESVAGFTLRASASHEFVTATVAGTVTVEALGDDIQVAITELAPGRSAEDARVYVPKDITIVTPRGLVHLDREAREALGKNITEQ